MSQLREFDIRSRGMSQLVDNWKANHDAVRQIWNVEDLINEAVPTCRDAAGSFDAFRQGKWSHDDADIPFGYFVTILGVLVRIASAIDEEAKQREREGFAVAGVQELRSCIEVLTSIIQEDRFATDAAFNGGAVE